MPQFSLPRVPGQLLGLVAFHLSALALAGWVASGQPLWILVAAPAAVAGMLGEGGRTRAGALAGALLLAGVVGVLLAERHLDRLARHWPERSLEWEARGQDRLAGALDDLLRSGEESAAALASEWAGGRLPSGPALPPGLRPVGVDALALFGSDGELIAWEGIHQGPIPDEVRRGASRYLYREGALFGYLYVTQPAEGGSAVAVAASLLRSDLPPVLGPPATDFESRFEAWTGARIEISRADQALGESVWDLRWEDEVLFSVTLLPASEAEARSQREVGWSRLITLLLLAGWALSIVGARSTPLGAMVGGGTLILILLLLPLGSITGWRQPFSPADFLLPGPLALTLGDLLFLGGAGVLVLGLLPWGRLAGLLRVPAALGAAILAAAVLLLLEAGASRDFVAGAELGWVSFQATAVVLGSLAFGLGVLLGGRRGEAEGVRPLLLTGSLALGLSFALGWAALVTRAPGLPWWVAMFWAIPLLGVARSIPGGTGWSMGAIRWASVGVLTVTLVLPWAWELRVVSRMAAAEERVERLGTRPDPFLEFLLLRAGEQAQELAAVERDPVEILYRAWTASGLAWEGFPLWITYWSPGGIPQEELRIGAPDARPAVPSNMFEEARDQDGAVVRRFDLADAHYIGVAPLSRGASVSIVVPPRRILSGASPLGPLFSPARSAPDPLVLIPLLPGEAPGVTEGVRWVSTADGWQGETYLAYPDEVYHAHYQLELPGRVLLLARGTLLLLLNVAGLGVLWALGRWMGEGRPRQGVGVGVLGSFRGRVTLALFAFFLVPSILFGMLAYRTLAGAAVRTAEALAERAAEDAAAFYFEVEGAMDLLARRVGSDLLLYEGGELVSGSLPELVRLGLYEGWLPSWIHEDITSGEVLMTTAISSLGGWEYVVAYRRMAGDRVLAAPAPLQAGATALRQRDVADLIGFSVVIGAIFSILLSLLVGRALARPIQTLRVASERVGAGNMGVHLPADRSDEFGAVFDAFNRMVDRLAQTRKALLRTSRRTRAIVEEVATGVVALDPHGRVTLANPQAAELLGAPLERHRPLPGGDDPEDPRSALVRWVEGYFRDGLREGGTELSLGERRIRIRARRVSRRGPPGGAVLSLEDVTDELRTERILAWGEMAQQVAHEVKNPLTPIQLGVQHIRRAWQDGQPDYEEILERNVNAILKEIERLASIASSFSRFAAPSPAGVEPLDAVDVREVIREVLDLYEAGGGPVAFEFAGEEDLPPVQGRAGELKEVLVNLLENARAALPEGGRVLVEVDPSDGGVELRVRDDGIGIPADLLPRIFEPHFSTHTRGTGLGLAIVKRLVESWGGQVHAESRPGRGTTIRIQLVPWSRGAGEGVPVPAPGDQVASAE